MSPPAENKSDGEGWTVAFYCDDSMVGLFVLKNGFVETTYSLDRDLIETTIVFGSH